MKGEDLGLIVKATAQIYWDCAKNASQSLVKSWEVLIGIIAGGLGLIIVSGMLSAGGMTGRFLSAILADALLAFYYGWLSEMVRNQRVSWKDLLAFDWSLFFSIIGVSFILYIIWLFSSPASYDPDTRYIAALVSLLVVFVFNAMPESIYIHRYESLAAFSLAARFTKENWIEWYLPFVLLLTPFMLLSQQPLFFLSQFALTGPLVPSTIFILGVSVVWPQLSFALSVLLGLLIAHWYMLFRGFLFIELESGTRRRRIYRAKQR